MFPLSLFKWKHGDKCFAVTTATRMPPAATPPLRLAPPGGMTARPSSKLGAAESPRPPLPSPPRGHPQAWMETGGQGLVVRVVAAAKLPPPPAAELPQPQMAGSTQPPTRGPPAPLPGPASWGQRPPSPPPGWQHPPPSSPPTPPPPAPGGATPSPHRSPWGGVACTVRSFPRAPLLAGASHLSWASSPSVIEGPTGPTSARAPDGPASSAAGGCSPCTPCSSCCSSSSSSSRPSSNFFSSSSTVGCPPPSTSSRIFFGTHSSS